MAPAYGWGGVLLGLALFLAPGVVWALYLGRALSWPARAALSVLLAFTLVPAAMFLLNLMFDVPVRVATFAFLAALFAGAGGLLLFRAPLRRLADR